jgi:hypothetical protein
MRPALLAAVSLVALACSSSSSSSSNPSLVGTWSTGAGSAVDGISFQSGGSCAIDVTSGGQLLCGDCTYQSSGDELTITIHALVDGGAEETITCQCALTFSNGGNTLEIKSSAGSGCLAFDATVDRQSGSSAFFCSM